MFARIVLYPLKANTLNDSTQRFEKDFIPCWRKQPGFRDEMRLPMRTARNVIAISLWDIEEQAMATLRTAYPACLTTWKTSWMARQRCAS